MHGDQRWKLFEPNSNRLTTKQSSIKYNKNSAVAALHAKRAADYDILIPQIANSQPGRLQHVQLNTPTLHKRVFYTRQRQEAIQNFTLPLPFHSPDKALHPPFILDPRT